MNQFSSIVGSRPTWQTLAGHRPRQQGATNWTAIGARPTTTAAKHARGSSSVKAGLPAFFTSPQTVLEAGDAAADPEVLLNRPTRTGLTEHELLLALNSHNEDDLQMFHGFGPRVAQKIIEFRATEKFFSSLDELVRVPLIGPTRFRKLVGRESQFYTLALHSTLRRPAPVDIRLSDLQPLNWPAPAVPRIFLGLNQDEVSEQEMSEQNSWHLHTRRVGRHVLFIHTNTHLVTGWAEHLLQALPRALRRSF